MFPIPVRPARRASSSPGWWNLAGRLVALLTVLAASALHAVPPGTEDEISARLTPVGSLCRAGDDCGVVAVAAPTAPRSGEEIYNSFCFACHAAGVGGAPVLGDAAQWAPRIDKGMDALWTTMQNGLNAMPPKGTCMNCSDDELRASLDYVLEGVQ